MASGWLSRAANLAQQASERAKEAAEKAAKEAVKLQKEASAAASGFAQGAERFFEVAPAEKVFVFQDGPLGFELDGAMVSSIEPQGQADSLGLHLGDRLVAVEGDEISIPPEEDTPEEAAARVKRLIRNWIKKRPRPVSLRFQLVPRASGPAASAAAADAGQLGLAKPAETVQQPAGADAGAETAGDGWEDLELEDLPSDAQATPMSGTKETLEAPAAQPGGTEVHDFFAELAAEQEETSAEQAAGTPEDVLPLTEESPKEEALAEQAASPAENRADDLLSLEAEVLPMVAADEDVLPLTEESPKEEALAEQAEHPLEEHAEMEHVPIEQPASPQEADDLLSLEAEVLPTVAADEDVLPLTEESPKEEALAEQAAPPLEEHAEMEHVPIEQPASPQEVGENREGHLELIPEARLEPEELQSMKTELLFMQQQLAQAAEEREREREAFGAQLQKLQQKWDEAESKVQQLSAQLGDAQDGLQSGRHQQKQLKKSEEECLKLTAKLEKETGKVEELKKNMDQVIKDAKERDEARMREIKQMREKKQQELQSFKEQSELSSKGAEALKQRLLDEASSELQELRSEATSQKEALSAMLREATAESAELRHSLEHQEAEAQNMDAVLREELLEAQNAQGRLRGELRSSQERGRKVDRELETAHAECKELMSTASSRDSRVEAAHTLLEGRVQSLQEQLESLREDLEAKAALEAERYQEDAEARYAELKATARSREEELVGERDALQARLQELQARLEKQETGQVELDPLRQRLQALQRDLETASQEVERRGSEASAAAARAEGAEAELARLRAEAQGLRRAAEQAGAEALEAVEAVESHKQLIRALQQSMAEQKEEAEQELQSLRKLSEPTPGRSASNLSHKASFELEVEEEEPVEAPLEVIDVGDSLLDQLESSMTSSAGRSKPPEAAGNEEAAQLWDRINYLERRNRTLQKKLDSRPIIYQAPTGHGPLNLEAGDSSTARANWEPWLQEVTGPVARRLHLQGYEQRVASVAGPLCQAIEEPLREFTARLLRRDRWLWVFYVHLLVLYAIAASCIARNANPVSPAECVDARLSQLQAAKQAP